MNSVLVKQTPQVFVLHYYGEIVGYVLDTPEGTFAIADDGKQIIQTESLQQFQDSFLDRMNCQMGVPFRAPEGAIGERKTVEDDLGIG